MFDFVMICYVYVWFCYILFIVSNSEGPVIYLDHMSLRSDYIYYIYIYYILDLVELEKTGVLLY